MACLIENQKCPVCAGAHDFYVAGGGVAVADLRCDFTCPSQLLWSMIDFKGGPASRRIVHARPTGTVLATPRG